MKLYLVDAESDYLLSSFYSMNKTNISNMKRHLDRIIFILKKCVKLSLMKSYTLSILNT